MKKKLTEADLALLRSRGKVLNGFTTSRDFNITSAPKTVIKRKLKKAPPAKNPLIGKKLHTSWGYDMTINDFCQIVGVSPSGKTVKCRMLTGKISGSPWDPGATGRASAGETKIGPTFRLKVTNDGKSFHGSYPFCGAENLPEGTKMSECSSKMGYFSLTDGRESYYENRCD